MGATRRGIWRLLRGGYLLAKYQVLPAIGHEIMRHRSPHRVVSVWPEGEIPLGPKVCVFVHWDRAGEVRDHVMHQVRSLGEAGLSVVFVSNCGGLRPAAAEALRAVCAGVIVRRNVGYDFGAWREGFEHLHLPRPDTSMVVMANDSVYGPLRPLHELFAAVDFDVADVWGCTDTWQTRYHLQSYFMMFSPRVVRSEAWRAFWAGVRPTWSKHWLVRLYEIGLTQALLGAGFRCRAVWPYPSLVGQIDLALLQGAGSDAGLDDPVAEARRDQAMRLREAVADRTPLNPTSDLWRQLLQARFPFIKRELLRDNPSRVPDVGEWREVAAEVSNASLAPIDRDLQRVLKNRTP